jgi:hypothetical protein
MSLFPVYFKHFLDNLSFWNDLAHKRGVAALMDCLRLVAILPLRKGR